MCSRVPSVRVCARACVCLCGRRSVCERERQGDEMAYDGGGGWVGGWLCVCGGHSALEKDKCDMTL